MDDMLPAYFKIQATITIDKPTAGLFLAQLSQIRGKNGGGDSASEVSFHHKLYQADGLT